MSRLFTAQYGKYARAFDGDVIGVCSHAMYAFDGENILVLHDRAYGILPFGVAVDGVVELLAALAPQEGERFTVKENTIACGGRTLTLAEKRRHADAPTHRLTPPRADRILQVEKILANNGSKNGVVALFEQNTGNAKTNADALCRAMRQNDAGTAADAATALLGLGRGLTPSGDDYICGFFSLLLAASESGVRVPACTERVCAAVISQLPRRTSRISGAYVRAALTGEFFSIYDAAASALLAKDADAEALSAFVLSMGASSGSDTLCGALAAARLISDRKSADTPLFC